VDRRSDSDTDRYNNQCHRGRECRPHDGVRRVALFRPICLDDDDEPTACRGHAPDFRERSRHPRHGASTEFINGYAIAAIMLLFLFRFVSRTRFVYAGLRTLVIAIGLGVAVVTYSDSPRWRRS
jgi:hypothetical protein